MRGLPIWAWLAWVVLLLIIFMWQLSAVGLVEAGWSKMVSLKYLAIVTHWTSLSKRSLILKQAALSLQSWWSQGRKRGWEKAARLPEALSLKSHNITSTTFYWSKHFTRPCLIVTKPLTSISGEEKNTPFLKNKIKDNKNRKYNKTSLTLVFRYAQQWFPFLGALREPQGKGEGERKGVINHETSDLSWNPDWLNWKKLFPPHKLSSSTIHILRWK